MTSLYSTFRYPPPGSHVGCYDHSEWFQFRNFENQYSPLWSNAIKIELLVFSLDLFFSHSSAVQIMAIPSFYFVGPKILNSSLTLAHHPHPVCHEILLALSLKYIQNHTLTTSAATTLIKVWLCTSHLDYYDSLLTDLPASTLDPS